MIKRCAIYTRKSTEEGLGQAFNSLDAQREACENYILSQKAEGWRAIRTRYDDGGLSGGNMERPALQALMQNIDDGKIDIVIVYKVDRFTRSLADFAKLVERFDMHDVSFVSVTQQFNTSNSMGRLTLNVLLSFAQFEREVGAERVRDKISASRKKGFWTGGMPPLGYDNIDKKLVVNKPEAMVVSEVYSLYEQHGCVQTIIRQAAEQGWRSKKRKNDSGGNLLTRGPIYWMLKNPIYTGLIKGKDALHEGQHEPIIERDKWEIVQKRLAEKAQRSGVRPNRRSPLAGLAFWSGQRLTPDHATKGTRRYRYYLSVKNDDSVTSRVRLKADDVETVLVETLSNWLSKPEKALGDIVKCRCGPAALITILEAIRTFNLRTANLSCAEKLKTWIDAITRIDFDENIVRLTINANELFGECAPDIKLNEEALVQSPCVLKKRGQEHRLTLGDYARAETPDPIIIGKLASAYALKEVRFKQDEPSWRAVLKEYSVDRSNSHRLLRLAFLAPDIAEAFLCGTAPIELNAEKLKRLSDLPADWNEQRRLLGISPPR
ncbi:MAG: recombinase family protein [Pseudomonadota bacterium]